MSTYTNVFMGSLLQQQKCSREEGNCRIQDKNGYLIIIQDVSVQAFPERHTLCRFCDDQHTVVLYKAPCKLQATPLSCGKHLHRPLSKAANHWRLQTLQGSRLCTVSLEMHSDDICTQAAVPNGADTVASWELLSESSLPYQKLALVGGLHSQK